MYDADVEPTQRDELGRPRRNTVDPDTQNICAIRNEYTVLVG